MSPRTLYFFSLAAALAVAQAAPKLQRGDTVPDGLVLLASGDIISHPTPAGTATFTLTLSDSTQLPGPASQTFTLPPSKTLHVQDLFNTSYLSQDVKILGGTFEYTQDPNSRLRRTDSPELRSRSLTASARASHTNSRSESEPAMFPIFTRIVHEDTWAAVVLLAVLLIFLVTILVRRDRRDRDLDRRALARLVANLSRQTPFHDKRDNYK